MICGDSKLQNAGALVFMLFVALASTLPAEVDRSPVDLVLAPDDSWLVTANQTSDTVSLVRTVDGEVLDEAEAGQHPTALALAPDGVNVFVCSRDSGQLRRFRVDGQRLVAESAIHLGFHPHGVAISPDGKTAYAALSAAAKIAVVDLAKQEVTDRIEVGRWPRFLALSPDGLRLAVGVSGDLGISVVDLKAGEQVFLEKCTGLNVGHLTSSRDGKFVYFPWMIYRRNPIDASNIRRGWVLGSRFSRMPFNEQAGRETLSLDAQGEAVADPIGIALTGNEDRIVVSASGTHELLVFRAEGLPYKDHGLTDHIDAALLRDNDRFWRLQLGGRPMGLQISSDDRTVYVANYLANSVQRIDLERREIVRTFHLGGPETPSLERQGEAIFYDARRSLDQWYSCHSCHWEGGTNAVTVDTLNDGTTFSFKTVIPLWRLDQTGPWTWHGWQDDLRDAMRKSLTSTMVGPEPSEEDVTALLAYLATRTAPPNPHRNPDGSLSEAAERGKAVFESDKAGCAQCHGGPYYTDGEVYDVGLGRSGDRYRGFNTPSLVGAYQKVRFLHDGRAKSLEEVLTGAHAPEDVAGEGDLTDDELADLIAYLESL
jgi:DNA-binding beta-propeller fold protein YncE